MGSLTTLLVDERQPRAAASPTSSAEAVRKPPPHGDHCAARDGTAAPAGQIDRERPTQRCPNYEYDKSADQARDGADTSYGSDHRQHVIQDMLRGCED